MHRPTLSEIVELALIVIAGVLPSRGGWLALLQDGNVQRAIRAPHFRETWTQAGFEGDRELNDRAIMPQEERRGLRLEKQIKSNPPFVREWPAAEGP